MTQQRIDIDRHIGQHAIDLFDRILGLQPAGQRQTLPDQGNCQRGGFDRPQRGSGQGEKRFACRSWPNTLLRKRWIPSNEICLLADKASPSATDEEGSNPISARLAIAFKHRSIF